MRLADKIQDLCRQKNTSIYKVERELGFGNGSIRYWNQSSPSVSKVLKVARYFNVSVDFLLIGDSERKGG